MFGRLIFNDLVTFFTDSKLISSYEPSFRMQENADQNNSEYSVQGLFEKWSTLDPKIFYAIPFQKLVFLISLYSEFLEKKNKEIKKKLIFGQFSLFLFRLPC